MKNNKLFLIIIIFCLSLAIRLIGLNWDQNQHLHPDERFLTMVTAASNLPKNISDYFNSKVSPLNPQNNGFEFYAYGTLPIAIVLFFGKILNLVNYDQIFLAGRVIAAVFDSSVVFVIFLICQKLGLKNKLSFFASFFYMLSILPIQLSHFFTTDPFICFFCSLTIYFFIKYLKDHKYYFIIISALLFGVTLSCKTSIIIAIPLFIVFIFLKSFKYHRLINPLSFIIFTFISFRVFNPYAFDGFLNLSPKFVQSVNVAHQMITGEYNYPPNIQWISTLPFFHPFINIFFFGFGPFLTFLFLIGFKKSFKFHFIFLFTILVFSYQSIQLAKYMRYFYPIYPLFCIIAAIGFDSISSKKILSKFFLVFIILNTFIFIGIYSNTHSRVRASLWILKNLPESLISFEYWDDSLPLNINSSFNKFRFVSLSMFDIENNEKINDFNQKITQVDYLVLSSNRFWKPIIQNSTLYPNASRFYQKLFSSNSDFKLIKTFYSYPGIRLPFLKKCVLAGPSDYPNQKNNFLEIDKSCDIPGIYFRDNFAEESFTVYDHPQVFIFSRL